MKGRFLLLTTLLSVFVMFLASTVVLAEKVEFNPVKAPSKGPDNAPVTVYEIGDFM